MTEEQDKAIHDAALMLEKTFPQHYGSVQFNLHGGRVANVNVNESVRMRTQNLKNRREG